MIVRGLQKCQCFEFENYQAVPSQHYLAVISQWKEKLIQNTFHNGRSIAKETKSDKSYCFFREKCDIITKITKIHSTQLKLKSQTVTCVENITYKVINIQVV